MAILTLQRRLREAGRIRIGAQVATKGGKTRPAKLDTFRLTSQDRVAIESAARLYGGQPGLWDGAPVGNVWEVYTAADTLPVVVPPAASALSQWFEAWSGGGCIRRCDGERELLTDSPCVCATEDEALCKPTTRLSVILAELPGLGVWRLETHGWYAATELAGTVEVCLQAATRGQLLPAALRLEHRQVKRPGEATRKFAVPVLDVQVTPSALGLVLGAPPPRQIEPGATWQPLDAADDDAPGDVAAAIRDAGTDGPKKRRNSPPDLPATGLRPRDTDDTFTPAATPTDSTLSEAQMRKLRALYRDVAITDTAEQKHVTAALLAVDRIDTHSTLTIDQASHVIDALTRVDAGTATFTLNEHGDVTGITDLALEGQPE